MALLLRGAWYSGTILAILGCHELGHYFACRYYDVDASLPFFLPAPFALTGTLGAFIRIREPIPEQADAVRHRHRRSDCRVSRRGAGAFSRACGCRGSRCFPSGVDGFELGEPLLFKFATWLIWGSVPDGYTVNLHPVAFGAWFGLLATALNLFPIGQFDGGHISYAVLGRKSSQVTLAMIGCAAVLTYFSLSWLVWTVIAIGDAAASSAGITPARSTKTCRSTSHDSCAGALRGRDVHPLLHAGADRTAQALTMRCQDVESDMRLHSSSEPSI